MGVQFDAGLLGKFVFGNQADRQQEGVAGDDLPGAGDRLPFFIHTDRFNRFNPVVADDAVDGALFLEGNAIIQEALDVIPGQTGQVGHDLQHALHLGAFNGQTAGCMIIPISRSRG